MGLTISPTATGHVGYSCSNRPACTPIIDSMASIANRPWRHERSPRLRNHGNHAVLRRSKCGGDRNGRVARRHQTVAARAEAFNCSPTAHNGERTATMNGYCVRRCLVCGNAAIQAKVDGRVVTTSCLACDAVLIIEFDPPDDPTLRARIERIDDAMDAEESESDPDRKTARRCDNQNSPLVLVASRRR
jgi:hypothetical protein